MLDRSSEDADPLGEVLRDLRLARASYCRSELSAPWGISFPPQPDARFHFVVEGECWLRAPGRAPERVGAGDVLLLPHGTGHTLSDAPRRAARPLDAMPLERVSETVFRMRAGGGGARTLLVCCSVGFEEPAVNPLLELMPAVLLVRRGGVEDPTLPTLLDVMAEETRAERVGAATVVARLADVVVARVVRAWAERAEGGATGWLAAIRDPNVGRALAAIHRRPGDPWTVAALARVAGASRSTFTERFAAVVGVPPARYLARWRMHLASAWLARENATVSEVAARLGYESDAAFSRAFKRATGRPPSALRRPAQRRA